MQALGLSKMARLALTKKPHLWWAGTLLFALASVINFAAFPFAPAAVLAPLESVQFVTNLLFARFVNKRLITPSMLMGSTLTIGGTVLTILFGPNTVRKGRVCIPCWNLDTQKMTCDSTSQRKCV